MSRERLEEFREFVDFMYESIDIEDYQRFIAISDSMLNDGWFKWIYRLAKEQAERVQELEGIKNDAIEQIDVTQRRNKRLENRVQELEEHLRMANQYVKKEREINTNIKQQNKRYREALEFYAGKRIIDGYLMDGELARKALEE